MDGANGGCWGGDRWALLVCRAGRCKGVMERREREMSRLEKDRLGTELLSRLLGERRRVLLGCMRRRRWVSPGQPQRRGLPRYREEGET